MSASHENIHISTYVWYAQLSSAQNECLPVFMYLLIFISLSQFMIFFSFFHFIFLLFLMIFECLSVSPLEFFFSFHQCFDAFILFQTHIFLCSNVYYVYCLHFFFHRFLSFSIRFSFYCFPLVFAEPIMHMIWIKGIEKNSQNEKKGKKIWKLSDVSHTSNIVFVIAAVCIIALSKYTVGVILLSPSSPIYS